METSEFIFELTCKDKAEQDKIEKRLVDMLENRGYTVHSNVSVPVESGYGGHLVLSEPEQQLVWDRLFTETGQGTDVYDPSDLDMMTGIMDKLLRRSNK